MRTTVAAGENGKEGLNCTEQSLEDFPGLDLICFEALRSSSAAEKERNDDGWLEKRMASMPLTTCTPRLHGETDLREPVKGKKGSLAAPTHPTTNRRESLFGPVWSCLVESRWWFAHQFSARFLSWGFYCGESTFSFCLFPKRSFFKKGKLAAGPSHEVKDLQLLLTQAVGSLR